MAQESSAFDKACVPDLLDRMLQVARAGTMGESKAADAGAKSVFDPVLSAIYQGQDAWLTRPGMRLPRIRGLLLRVLAPYVERQETINALLSACVVLLSEEVVRLEAEVAESRDRSSRAATR